MPRGKKTCRILKEIRRQIAEANDIEYVVEECQYKGDCKGTCPKCEAEVRYLEEQLHRRQMLGKAVVVAGLSLGVIPASMAQEVSVVEANPSTEVVSLQKEVTGKYIIKGKIVDENGYKVMGATICIAKTNKGVLSDINGEFALGVDSLPNDIKVVYIGYETFMFKVTETNYNNFFTVTLVDDHNIIGEIIVVDRKAERKARKKRKTKSE